VPDALPVRAVYPACPFAGLDRWFSLTGCDTRRALEVHQAVEPLTPIHSFHTEEPE